MEWVVLAILLIAVMVRELKIVFMTLAAGLLIIGIGYATGKIHIPFL